jgi:hypothetical protein
VLQNFENLLQSKLLKTAMFVDRSMSPAASCS